MLPNNSEYSVKFSKSVDMGRGPQKAFPFVYAFVNNEDDTWEVNKATNVMDSLGVLVPAGATVDHAIKLDQDFPFKLLWIKYSVYHNYGGSGTYIWYEPILAGSSGCMDEAAFDYNYFAGTPLLRSIRISVSMHGPDGRYLYGGFNLDNTFNALGVLQPINPQAIQGYDYGYGQIRTEYLLPTQAIVRLQITNNHAVKDLYVTGILYGMKVRL